MKKTRNPLFIAVLFLVAISCVCPAFQATEEEPSGLTSEDQTATALAAQSQDDTPATATFTGEPTATDTLTATTCVSTLVTNSSVNIRSGPGLEYPILDAVTQGTNLTVAGKNDTGTWWYIEYPSAPGGYAWISGSVTTATCIPDSLSVIVAPPTPLPPSGSCKGDYVHRLIKPSDKVCVSPASKAQADADNAAAASRLATATYGPDTCMQGYVWRDAFTDDHVCVEPAVRAQAAADNAAAASRWTSGAYGPHTCIAGYVWREAKSGDDVCVEPAVRTQAAADNAAAASRLATAIYGPDTCAQGYVWRDAFTDDHVCVEPAIRTQTAADNADAPNHTWP
jgi:hypothetical protein